MRLTACRRNVRAATPTFQLPEWKPAGHAGSEIFRQVFPGSFARTFSSLSSSPLSLSLSLSLSPSLSLSLLLLLLLSVIVLFPCDETNITQSRTVNNKHNYIESYTISIHYMDSAETA